MDELYLLYTAMFHDGMGMCQEKQAKRNSVDKAVLTSEKPGN
jgi:hypothetical protein